MKTEIDITKIYPDPDQPRQVFPKESMLELKRSIKKQGILSPVLVESNYKGDNYLLIDGERRYRCSLELNLKKIPVDIIEGPLSKADRTIKRFHIQGKVSDWNYFDKARAIYQFKKDTNYTLMKIADLLEIHLPRVHGLISLIELSPDSQSLLIDNKIPFNYSSVIVRIIKHYKKLIPDEKQEVLEKKLIDKIIKEHLTVSQLNMLSQIISSNENKRDKIKYLLTDNYSFNDLINLTDEGQKKYTEEFLKFLVTTNKLLTKHSQKKIIVTSTIEKELNTLEKSISNIKNK
jgi:ParB family chromosome partitioning protein